MSALTNTCLLFFPHKNAEKMCWQYLDKYCIVMVIKSKIVRTHGAKRTHEADEKFTERFSQSTSQKSHSADLFIDGGIILKLILQK
jgi:hypothetical protein